jgi:TatD DNase family protein
MVPEEELTLTLAKAKQSGVGEIISCSTSFTSNETNLDLSRRYPQIKTAIGLYPLDIVELNNNELNRAFDFFKFEIDNSIAIGEIGLDFKYSRRQEEQTKQIEVFNRFIDMAVEYNKPLIVHSRFAQSQVLELLNEKNPSKVLLHSFVDSQKLMRKATQLGYYVSCGLSVLWNEEVQKNIKEFPLEKLLFETDSPITFKEFKATPDKIYVIAEKVAQIKGITLKEIEGIQEKNYRKLFY